MKLEMVNMQCTMTTEAFITCWPSLPPEKLGGSRDAHEQAPYYAHERMIA